MSCMVSPKMKLRLWKAVDPLPVLPPNLSADLGEGRECAVFMKTKIQTQIKVVPPPLSLLFFDNGGGVPLFGTEGVGS
jgi:hypothetical protein